MTEIGRLQPAKPDSLASLSGYIQTLDARLLIRVTGDEALCDDRRPSHRVVARTGNGADVEIGAAWLKTAKHGLRAGERFLSLSIDYPGLSAALNVAAFRDKASSDWVVLWRRRSVQDPEASVA